MSGAYRGSIGTGEAFQNNVGVGAAIGAGAYVVNYVLVYLFVMIDGVDYEEETWKSVGNVLYNAQFVDLEMSGGGASQTYNYLSSAASSEGAVLTSTVPELVYNIAPVVVLLVAGAVAVTRVGSRLDTVSAAVVGATIAAGYLVLSALGTFLFEITSEGFGGTTTTAPELVPAIVIMGLALPLVLGAVGGVLGNEL